MRKGWSEPGFVVDPWLLTVIAGAVLLLPVRWLFGWMIAALTHEMSHYLAIRAFGVRVCGLKIGVTGVQMETEPMTPGTEILCAAAGPIGGFLLVLTARWIPVAAFCGFVQSIFNCIPIYPLDGGRILYLLSERLPHRLRKGITVGAERLTLFLVLSGCVYAALTLKLGLLPLFLAVMILFRRCKRKIPCKPGKLRVQYSKSKERGTFL